MGQDHLAFPDHNENLEAFADAKVYSSNNIQDLNKKYPQFKIYKTPGHTKKDIVILYGDVLFSGDVIFDKDHYYVGRTDLPESIPDEMEKSLELVKKIPYKILCPGHIVQALNNISKKEVDKINKVCKRKYKKVISPSGQTYYLIKEDEKTKRCFFLTKDNKCEVQKAKPLDCLCYPIKAVYRKNNIKFIGDKDCPALPHLSKEFIAESKKVALKSIKRFEKVTYNHWLKTYGVWAKD